MIRENTICHSGVRARPRSNGRPPPASLFPPRFSLRTVSLPFVLPLFAFFFPPSIIIITILTLVSLSFSYFLFSMGGEENNFSPTYELFIFKNKQLVGGIDRKLSLL